MFTGSSGVHGNHYSFELGGNALVFRFPGMMLLLLVIFQGRHTLLLQAVTAATISHGTPWRCSRRSLRQLQFTALPLSSLDVHSEWKS